MSLVRPTVIALTALSFLAPALQGLAQPPPTNPAPKPRPGSILDPAGTPVGEPAEGIPRKWHEDCDHPRRRPVSLILGLDDHRSYRPAHLGEAMQSRALLQSLCKGDRVTIAVVQRTPKLLGEPTVIKDLSDLDDLVLRVEQRREPKQFTRINNALLEVALAEWGRAEARENKDLLKVLIFFTRELESKRPDRAYVSDFSWADPPYWLQDDALVSIFRPITSDTTVQAWEVFVVGSPEWTARDAVGQGFRVDLHTWLTPLRIKPEPPAPKAAAKPSPDKKKIEIPPALLARGIEPPELPELWKTPDGALLWDQQWLPWIIAGALLFLLLLTIVWALARQAPKRQTSLTGEMPERELVLVLHDRLHNKVLSEEKTKLISNLRVGPSVSSDVVVPGPYSLELIAGTAGGAPRLRSTNTLAVELQRATGGRILRATEAVPVPVRPGDRISLGGGHELEIRFAN